MRLPVPWLYERRALARAWGIPPPAVDDYPAYEIAAEQKITALEAANQPRRK